MCLSKFYLKELRSVFDQYDKDGTGQIDANELKNVLESLDLHLNDKQVTELINKIDTSGNDKLEFEGISIKMYSFFLNNNFIFL